MREYKLIISSVILGISILASSYIIYISIGLLASVVKTDIHVTIDHNLGYGKALKTLQEQKPKN